MHNCTAVRKIKYYKLMTCFNLYNIKIKEQFSGQGNPFAAINKTK